MARGRSTSCTEVVVRWFRVIVTLQESRATQSSQTLANARLRSIGFVFVSMRDWSGNVKCSQ
jgi:hypothetical protein